MSDALVRHSIEVLARSAERDGEAALADGWRLVGQYPDHLSDPYREFLVRWARESHA